MCNKDGLTSHNAAVCTNECHHSYRQTDHTLQSTRKIFAFPCVGGLYTTTPNRLQCNTTIGFIWQNLCICATTSLVDQMVTLVLRAPWLPGQARIHPRQNPCTLEVGSPMTRTLVCPRSVTLPISLRARPLPAS